VCVQDRHLLGGKTPGCEFMDQGRTTMLAQSTTGLFTSNIRMTAESKEVLITRGKGNRANHVSGAGGFAVMCSGRAAS